MRSASARCSTEYQKAPAVTRDRLYIDTMQQVYSNVSKVMVDSRSRLEPAVPAAGQADAARPRRPRRAAPATAVPTPAAVDPTGTQSVDIRSRDGARSRDREGR